MSISTNLVVTTKDTGNKTKTTNLNYVNPDAADSSLATFATTLFGLSSHTFVGVERVDKHELTVSKPSPNLSLDPTGVSIGGGNPSATVNVTRQGNGAITATLPANATGKFTATVEGTVITVGNADGSSGSYSVTVSVAETDDYAAATATLLVVTSGSGTAPIPE